MSRLARRLAFAAVFAVILPRASFALPTMVRLGYANCAACHISPQGGGLLNDYGRSIDRAQSLFVAEYQPSESPFIKAINLNRRITQDLRLVMQDQERWTEGQSGSVGVFRPRLMYRNSTNLGAGFRVSAMVTGETDHAPRPALSYDPAAQPDDLFVNSALLNYRPSKSFELEVGRDQLPSGVNGPDLAAYARSRNRLGYYDSPLQAKLFWSGSRFQVTPFVYHSSDNQDAADRETGGGSLAEVNFFGQKAVVGMSLLHGTSDNGDRTMIGAYTRLGFGRWGILAEHDVTDRTRTTTPVESMPQQATFAQVFVALKEWLVASGVGERLRVEAPFDEYLTAGRVELAARFAPQATLTLGARVERDMRTDRLATSLIIQAAFKTAR